MKLQNTWSQSLFNTTTTSIIKWAYTSQKFNMKNIHNLNTDVQFPSSAYKETGKMCTLWEEFQIL